MRIFRGPNIWYDGGYDENRYHVDIVLEPGDELLVEVRGNNGDSDKVKLLSIRCPGKEVVKVHIFLSWSEDLEIARRPNTRGKVLLPKELS